MFRNSVPFGRKVAPAVSISAETVVHSAGASDQSIAYENERLMRSVCDALRPLVNQTGDMLVWRRPFRWHCDEGAIPNGYEMFELDELAEHLQMEVVHDFCHAGVLRRRVQ